MKSKNLHHATPVCNGNSSENSSPSPPPSPCWHSIMPHYRRLLRSKTFSQSRRESSVSGVIIRRGLRYFLLLLCSTSLDCSCAWVSSLVLCGRLLSLVQTTVATRSLRSFGTKLNSYDPTQLRRLHILEKVVAIGSVY